MVIGSNTNHELCNKRCDKKMIYYLCPYSISAEVTAQRNLIVSQAACNRINEIVNTISEKTDVTIVSNALSQSTIPIEECVQNINSRCNAYFPFISGSKNQNLEMIASIISYVNKNIKKGDSIVFYNAHYLMLPVICAFCRNKSIKIVYQIEEFYSTSDYYGGMKKRLLEFTESCFSKMCDVYIAVSETLTNKHLVKKPHIISYGYVDPVILENYVEKVPGDRLNIVYAGRLDVDGGIDVLLRVIPRINFKCNVVITGNGPLRDSVLNYTNKNPLVNIDYRGFVDDQELDLILQKADVCLSMLRADKAFSQKSFPSKVIKYLSYGNLVISSDVPALNDLKNLFPNLLIYNNEEKFSQLINEGAAIVPKMNKTKQKNNFDHFYNKKRKELSSFFAKMKA